MGGMECGCVTDGREGVWMCDRWEVREMDWVHYWPSL